MAKRAPGATCKVNELHAAHVYIMALFSRNDRSRMMYLKSTSPVSLICEFEMIRMLGGSPMPVAVPPILEKIYRATNPMSLGKQDACRETTNHFGHNDWKRVKIQNAAQTERDRRDEQNGGHIVEEH